MRHKSATASINRLRKRLIAARKSKEYKAEAAGMEPAPTGGYLVYGKMTRSIEKLFNQWRDKMSTRAQIGIYEDNDMKAKPVSIIYRHIDGYPTGDGSVMPDLVQFVSEIVGKRGSYDPEYLAAQLVYRFIEAHDCGVSGTGYGVSQELHGDIRFYYAVTPEGVHVFDARELTNVTKLPKPIFFTSWIEPERVRKVEKELSELTSQVRAKQLELKGLKQKQYNGR